MEESDENRSGKMIGDKSSSKSPMGGDVKGGKRRVAVKATEQPSTQKTEPSAMESS